MIHGLEFDRIADFLSHSAGWNQNTSPQEYDGCPGSPDFIFPNLYGWGVPGDAKPGDWVPKSHVFHPMVKHMVSRVGPLVGRRK